MVPSRALPIITCLEKFRDIKDGCFGWDLAEDYKERIQSFTRAVASLQEYCQVPIYCSEEMIVLQGVLNIKMNITWKIHMICCHLEPQLTRLGRGLGVLCEQAGEAVHAKFKKTEAR